MVLANLGFDFYLFINVRFRSTSSVVLLRMPIVYTTLDRRKPTSMPIFSFVFLWMVVRAIVSSSGDSVVRSDELQTFQCLVSVNHRSAMRYVVCPTFCGLERLDLKLISAKSKAGWQLFSSNEDHYLVSWVKDNLREYVCPASFYDCD